MYDNTHCIKNSTLCCPVFFFYVCFFAWLADCIWKISGCKTDSLINMALPFEQMYPDPDTDTLKNVSMYIYLYFYAMYLNPGLLDALYNHFVSETIDLYLTYI